jgi:predicted NBD/HSP70 family sugar kinase
MLTLDPDVLVIGGGISQAGPRILESVDQHLQRLVLTPTPLRLSALGGDAVVTGAVRYALDDVAARLLPSADAAEAAAGQPATTPDSAGAPDRAGQPAAAAGEAGHPGEAGQPGKAGQPAAAAGGAGQPGKAGQPAAAAGGAGHQPGDGTSR